MVDDKNVDYDRHSLIDNLPNYNEGKTKKIGIHNDDKSLSSVEIRSRSFSRLCKNFCRKSASSFASLLGEDWFYLVSLGVLMGIFSFANDVCVVRLRNLHYLIFDLAGVVHVAFQYSVWVLFTLVLVLISASLCHYIAPQAIGSGIPEMKTILRGVVLKEYLTFRTLVVKFVGLILVLGSGLPIGKEIRPFVHIASMIARLLSHFAASFKGIFENESRHTEMLAAACAVGLASTNGAPVGGVLFSIEVTSVFFPVRNYWRGFLSTVSSAITFRLLSVLFALESTVVAFISTSFSSDYPFDPKELFVFAFIGIACGFAGAFFVWIHRKYVTLVLRNGTVKRIMDKCHLLYPTVIVLILASLKCPLGYGHYFAGGLTPRQALTHMFSNFSWLDSNYTDYASNSSREILEYWANDRDIFTTLALFTFNMFWMTIVAQTLPVPTGVLIPVFVTGAAFGRMVGEAMALLFPFGVRTDGEITKIVPAAYAIVGACSLTGAITHTLSMSVLVVEITGQILYILPTMLGVLLANAICSKFQPSIYDSIICIKKLPYIPAMPPVSSGIHKIYVQDIMVKDVKYLTLESTYGELQDLLISMPKLKTFPLVDGPSSMSLLGSIRRDQLQKALDRHVGEKARKSEASKLRYENSLKSNLLPVDRERGSRLSVTLATDTTASRPFEIIGNSKPSRFTVRRVKSSEHMNKDTIAESSSKVNADSGTQLQTDPTSDSSTLTYSKLANTVQSLSAYVNALPTKFRRSIRRVTYKSELDLNDEDRIRWEREKLKERVNFDQMRIDPAPFQLVERTSLYRVHALFWLIGLNRAYVTSLGRLIGVVALRELRFALERVQPSAKVDKSVEKRMKLEADRNRLQFLSDSTKGAANSDFPPPRRSTSINPAYSLVPHQLEALHVIQSATDDNDLTVKLPTIVFSADPENDSEQGLSAFSANIDDKVSDSAVDRR